MALLPDRPVLYHSPCGKFKENVYHTVRARELSKAGWTRAEAEVKPKPSRRKVEVSKPMPEKVVEPMEYPMVRAREDDGRYKGDDPKTPENEAWNIDFDALTKNDLLEFCEGVGIEVSSHALKADILKLVKDRKNG